VALSLSSAALLLGGLKLVYQGVYPLLLLFDFTTQSNPEGVDG
jgi:hypothetical protein